MLKPKILTTDILIVGGGTAGCFAALTAAETSQAQVLIVEKAHIKRSGCLAAGVNALNAYLPEGETPESYLEYVRQDAAGVVREDLVFSLAQNFNRVTRKLEELGLRILKDADGHYVVRGRHSIKINGENIKPLLASSVAQYTNIRVLNRVNVTDYICREHKVVGVLAFSLEKDVFYVIYAKAVICATGGAAGLYRPNNPGFSRHKMWYCPFNTGAGYAMGIRAGAEMTGFEMRFIALRCKDTIAPTGTIAQGVKAVQVNGRGEEYLGRYAGILSTPMRLWATVAENQRGLGPCYLQTEGITVQQEEELYKAYLNMAPAQVLSWLDSGRNPRLANVEITGTEPYIVGGHCASGYWVDSRRATTLPGLFVAGDAAGGCPKKYVPGCLAEGEIAALSALEYSRGQESQTFSDDEMDAVRVRMNRCFDSRQSLYNAEQTEEAMQKIMDEYAGGIGTGYLIDGRKLAIAARKIQELLQCATEMHAENLPELLHIQEVVDRLYVCKVVIAHMQARKETRWPGYQQNADYPERDDPNWLKYVNSRYRAGKVEIVFRDIVKKGEFYEHSD
ncbi:L-aspartate oxidase [Peptococcaceae bacterium CEB3]|nr:L-aspartate oxidase [Peptococcaceae bacterium CEB3]